MVRTPEKERDMTIGKFMRGALIGIISGYVGTKAMTPVTAKLMEMESDADKEQEKKVSPGVSYNLAAKQLAGVAGIELDKEQASTVGNLFHLGLGLTAGEMYVVLRRAIGLGPISSSVLVGMALFLGIDEGLTPAMGWGAPPQDYPMATHVRGLVGHLTLGLTVGATAETLHWLIERP
jgi:uncharacterized membrane protein YagU involved in acid resistance